MQIRNARVQDVPAIHALISCYAELDRMLFRSLADIYENLQVFQVAEANGTVVGCCALKVIWSNLAEIQSLAVDKGYFGKGIGRALVNRCLEEARRLGITQVFTLTMEPVFFEKVGFRRVDKKTLPMKVWSDCARCPKQDHCDETAMIIDLGEPKKVS
ncbi:MAG TPA: N-acetyltransferase [Anaerohalosphaeraceae bacterium]|nr:N-acetyltransferase [Anaerohalosphaeraceae bacterium]